MIRASLVANVRCVVPKFGTFTTKMGIESSSLIKASHLLSREFDAKSIMFITQKRD